MSAQENCHRSMNAFVQQNVQPSMHLLHFFSVAMWPAHTMRLTYDTLPEMLRRMVGPPADVNWNGPWHEALHG